jgi:hypothetical protein
MITRGDVLYRFEHRKDSPMQSALPAGPVAAGSIVEVRAWWSRKPVRCKVDYALDDTQIAVTPLDGSYTRIVNVADLLAVKKRPPADIA